MIQARAEPKKSALPKVTNNISYISFSIYSNCSFTIQRLRKTISPVRFSGFYCHYGKFITINSQFFIRWNVIVHIAIVEFFICNHIKISGACKTKYNRFFFPVIFAFQCFINSNTYRMGTFPVQARFLLLEQSTRLLQRLPSVLHRLLP